jgi:hypothetical protein
MIDTCTWQEALPRIPSVDGYRNRLPLEDLLDRVESRPILYFKNPAQA